MADPQAHPLWDDNTGGILVDDAYSDPRIDSGVTDHEGTGRHGGPAAANKSGVGPGDGDGDVYAGVPGFSPAGSQ